MIVDPEKFAYSKTLCPVFSDESRVVNLAHVNQLLQKQAEYFVKLLQDFVDDYDDTGCEGCGVVSERVFAKACKALTKEKE